MVPQFVGCGTGFGNSGVGIMSCCTQFNFDCGIIKNTIVGGLREDANLQFRVEFFNLWNHAQFNPPGNAFGGAELWSDHVELGSRAHSPVRFEI